MKILLVDPNMMSASRVENALRAADFEFQTVGNLEKSDGEFEIVLWNFGGFGWTPESIEKAISSSKMRFPHAKIAAFCGHREIERWRAAQKAGIEKMFSNDQMLGETAQSLKALSTES